MIGREELLYELLKRNSERRRHMREVHYLCDPFNQQTIDESILFNLGKTFSIIKPEPQGYRLISNVKGSIQISFSEYSINVRCDGSRMLDLDLFVALSNIDNLFFAVMEEEKEWGWLKPIKYTKSKHQNLAFIQ